MEDNAKVTLEMRIGKFTCAVKTLDGINDTLRILKMPHSKILQPSMKCWR